MRLLLDTHVLLWWMSGDRRLTSLLREAISARDADVAVSAASVWEIAIKRALGRLDIDLGDLVDAIQADGFAELPVRIEHAAAVEHLPRHHDDPFDRLLIAQSLVESRRLVTRDRLIGVYSAVPGLNLFWPTTS
jgi:PIN domain nuclease of toxin-antitoxin system